MTIIRRLQPDTNFDDLIALSKAFFEEYEAHHEDFFKIDVLQDADIVRYFSKTLDTDNAATFVAIQDGRIVGYITVFIKEQPGYWKVKRVGDISGLMVYKDYRRRGIASQLLAEATTFIRTQGVRYFTVYTAATNQTAIAFYKHNGMNPLYVTLLGEIAPHSLDLQ